MPQDHSGRRSRMRERYRSVGPEGFDDVDTLEFLLYYLFPRHDTRELAHRLLDTFGSLYDVMHASEDQLLQVKGMGEAAAVFFPFLRSLESRIVLQSKDLRDPEKRLTTPRAMAEYMIPRFYEAQTEEVWLLCLDAHFRPLKEVCLGRGSSTSTGISGREAAKAALSQKTVRCVLFHNHPGGTMRPSREDLEATASIAAMLSGMDITLTDHLIIAGDQWYSMASAGDPPFSEM